MITENIHREQLQQAIDEKNLTLARSNLEYEYSYMLNVVDYCLLRSADYAAKELKKSSIELFVEDDGEYVVTDKANWDKKLWDELRIAIVYNFSREKIMLMDDLMHHLREQGHPDFQVEEVSEEESLSERATNSELELVNVHSSDSNEYISRDYYLGGGAGAILGGVGGKLFGYGVAGLVVGVALGLAVVYYKNSRG